MRAVLTSYRKGWNQMSEFEARVAVITGAGSGRDRALAPYLANQGTVTLLGAGDLLKYEPKHEGYSPWLSF